MDQHHAFEPLQAEPRRRRVSTGDPEPDALLRRTPSGHASAQDTTSQSDPDTCRICRGEAMPDEPLFYPCKCSGSIKYVHQDCLMEWLSHSQKKHCELCKTPFRFTKLYAPNMPKTVPFYVFISHIAKYLFRNMMVWARGGLVLMVWLVWLPYLMRRVWSALFWLSDEGLGPVFGRPEASSILRESSGSTAGAATCPSSPLHAATTTAASLQAFMSHTPRGSSVVTTTTLYGINITSDNPLSNILLNMFLGTFYIGGAASRNNTSASLQNTAPATVAHQPTLLSEVRFLQKISASSPALGSFAIDILEGQIITVLVIICFILIILVRDYVVQQQPDLNMRAAFAAAENAAPQENVAPAAAMPDPAEALRPEDIDRLRGPEAQDIEFGLDGILDENEEEVPVAWARVGEPRLHPAADGQTLAAAATATPDSPLEETSQHNMSTQTTLAALPSTPDARVAEVGRSTVDEYVRIHRAAAGDPETIINIIRQENLEDRLAYFVQLTQSQMNRKRPETHTEEEESSSQMAEWGSEPEWAWAEDAQQEGHSGKGKAPLTNGSLDARGEQSHASRPRSATDGPQRVGGINPLGNNNWSWPDAPLESSRADPRHSPTLGMASSSHGTHPEENGSASQPWAFATPPSSTLAESVPSSSQGQTPGSSEVDDVPADELDPEHAHILDPTLETRQSMEWEALPDFNEPFEVQPNEDAEDIGDIAQGPPQADGLARRLADFMWRDVEAIPAHELPPLPDAADEFFDHDQDAGAAIAQEPLPELQDQEQDQEVAAAAAAAGIDAEAEAIEDAEDLEGILELLGMRGPIAGLFQNALFCAFLVSITLFLGVFLPYNLGRLAIWLVANPARPVRILFSLSKLVQDTALLLMGLASTLLFGAIDTLFTLIQPTATRPEMISQSMQGSWNMTENAFQRLLDSMWTDLPFISADEVRNFSTVSHVALVTLKSQVTLVFTALGKSMLFLFGGDYSSKAAELGSWATITATTAWQGLGELPGLVLDPTSWVIDLGGPENAVPLKAGFASWSAMDRVWAILGGYVALSFSAALYLGRGGPISPGRVGQEWEATLIDALNQASGVMKVILIIGIEMLVFPLYCGLLLDIGLLPLFENTTIVSRVMFTVNYPLTSIFVHWFVGTGYMFHFALFVSMCRKIMRKGVLYFIRDPDDAEFHPVRDVLERNVTTQLRKILFSAFVYGALVIVCLGGVVWALSYGFQNVLPIHYSSNEPVLEFPIDLLFYNFLMPLAVKFFKPSDGLHAMYTWWFRKLARTLRLTWFLFGERKLDEEGKIQMLSPNEDHALPVWKRMFLEVEGNKVIPKTWEGTFEGGKAKPALPLSPQELEDTNARKAALVRTHQLIPDGRFVRAPASDQVKIPKGQRVFLDVTEGNSRQDRVEQPGVDLYSTPQYQFVYVPPNFRLRIFLFILFIWIFAAATGLGFTIIPLLFGRWMFRSLIPDRIRTNDIYAFSIGIYILGSAAYFLFHSKEIYEKAKKRVASTTSHILQRETLHRAAAAATRAAKLIYAYFFLLVVFPLMVASLMELYVLIPLDTYMYGAVVSKDAAPDSTLLSVQNPRHTVRVMQSWTIGVIYLKLAARYVVAWHRESRVAAATRAVLRRGWLEPDVKVLTRAFVVPGLSVWTIAVFGPPLLARACIAYGMAAGIDPSNDAAVVLVHRFCFFAALLSAIGVAMLRSMLGVFRSWRVRIRDEAYLIGERLHNFGLGQAGHDPQRERRRTRVGFD